MLKVQVKASTPTWEYIFMQLDDDRIELEKRPWDDGEAEVRILATDEANHVLRNLGGYIDGVEFRAARQPSA
jgi:hypothetical protein